MKQGNITEIREKLAALSKTGGRVFFPVGCYGLTEALKIDTPCLRLEGEAWNYSSDPNGVFESDFGTKLRLVGRDFPAVSVGIENVVGGVYMTELGFQGDIEGMDTRPLYVAEHPAASAGLHFAGTRIDQCEFSKLSFCGLSSAICATDNAEIDGSTFSKINTDGCNIGIYYAPRASYYVRFERCIVADTPFYGLYLAAKNGANMHNIDISGTSFVRNCGSPPSTCASPAAVYFDNVTSCALRDCIIDYSGTFWYYPADATKNDDRQVSKRPAVGLRLVGNKNRIINNVFTHSSCESIVINGSGNVLSGNIVDGDVLIEGEGNTVANLIFTKPNARLILKGCAKHSTVLLGVEEQRTVIQ